MLESRTVLLSKETRGHVKLVIGIKSQHIKASLCVAALNPSPRLFYAKKSHDRK